MSKFVENKFFLDAGTTWSKILEISPSGERKRSVLPSSELKGLALNFERVTGHSSRKNNNYVNEVVALARGAKEVMRGAIEIIRGAVDVSVDNSLILDLGSRDVKWVKFQTGKFHDMDWNSSCGSATGATVEMLLKFYNVEAGALKFESEKYPVVCGIFGLEKIMDEVSQGIAPEIAISKFIHGLAFNAFNFCKNPDMVYVSGGFCENKCFMDSLNYYCSAIPLGRFVLVEGLAACS